ncbi:MAG: carbon-nitrogen hydrolase family protein [Pseudomonadota bacterium]
MRVGLVQVTSSDNPSENLKSTTTFVQQAVDQGAQFILTPEVTNCVSASRTHQSSVLTTEEVDQTLDALRNTAATAGVWLLIGSLALKSKADSRFLNRSFLIDSTGDISARYDKIHMFDVALSASETYKESDGYRPGDTATVAQMDGVALGMTICYDIRFPYLYRDLAKHGAQIMTVPSAFSPDTGPGHWEPLLRARAIETGSYVLAPAQTGQHHASRGRARCTWGHSLVVDPWGTVVSDAGDAPGIICADLDISKVQDARRRLPSLSHDRTYKVLRDG